MKQSIQTQDSTGDGFASREDLLGAITLPPFPAALGKSLQTGMASEEDFYEVIPDAIPDTRTHLEPNNRLLLRRAGMEAAMRSLASPIPTQESRAIAEAVHDARNLLTALGLYCELLEEPGVLNEGFRHYGRELRLVTAATRRLIEKISAVQPGQTKPVQSATASLTPRPAGLTLAALPQTEAICKINLAATIAENQNLLSALAGPGVLVEVETNSGNHPVALAAEDMTRILVNLVRNAAEAMPGGGRIHIRTQDGYFANPAPDASTLDNTGMTQQRTLQPRTVLLTVKDDGPGLPAELRENIFEAGFSTKPKSNHDDPDHDGRRWPSTHRGLGLAIVRALVETAGGTIRLLPAKGEVSQSGACFQMELPVC